MTAPPRVQRFAAWVLCIGLGALFAVAGSTKLVGGAEVVQRFDAWSYSEAFRLFIGLCEIFGALGLLIPRLALSSCAGLGGIMLGAIYTHGTHREPVWFPLVVLALIVAAGWLRRSDAFFTRARPVWMPRA